MWNLHRQLISTKAAKSACGWMLLIVPTLDIYWAQSMRILSWNVARFQTLVECYTFIRWKRINNWITKWIIYTSLTVKHPDVERSDKFNQNPRARTHTHIYSWNSTSNLICEVISLSEKNSEKIKYHLQRQNKNDDGKRNFFLKLKPWIWGFFIYLINS